MSDFMMHSILLIDDERTFIFVTSKLIELSGAQASVLTAANGREGLARVEEIFASSGALPRLILVDFYMSPMDGVEFVRSFHKLDLPGKENTLIALVSSSVDRDDIALAKSVGVNAVLPKPISETDLGNILKESGLL